MAKRTWKNAPARRAGPVRRAPGKSALPKSLTVPSASTFKATGDARRDSLMRQIESAQQALDAEKATGFGTRSKNAAEHLSRLNKELADYDASGFGPKAYEIGKTVVPATVGGYGGYRIARGMGERAAKVAASNVERFGQVAKQVERLRKNTPNGVVGSKAGDKLVALVNEGFTLGGARQPFRSVPTLATSIVRNARPLFARAGGKFGAGLVIGLAAEGIVSRYVLPNYTSDPVFKDSLTVTGTASIAAAVTYSVKRKIDMAKPGLKPAATEIAKVTAAHGQIVREIGAKGGGPVLSGRAAALKAAGRVILPAAVGAAVVLAYARSARAGESRGVSLAKAVVAGADEATLGATSGANRALAGEGGVSGFIARTTVRAVAGSARAIRASLLRRGAVRSVAPVNRPLARRGSAPVKVSNGRVESYYRVQGGKSVFVHGYSRA